MSGADYRLAIDYGSSQAAAAVAGSDGRVEPIDVDGRATVPSIVVLSRGQLVAGRAAAEAAVARPSSVLPDVKGKLGQLGPIIRVPRDIAPEEAAAATMALLVAEAVAQHAGQGPSRVTLTTPAAANDAVRRALETAVRLAGITDEIPVTHLRADVAAAQRLAPEAPEGSAIAVLDVGVGCVASVLLRTATGFEPIDGPFVDPALGGDRVDQFLTDHVLGRLDPALASAIQAGATTEDLVAQATLARNVRAAKELLGAGSPVEVAAVRAGDPPISLGPTTVDALLLPMLLAVADGLEGTLRHAGVEPSTLAAICLTGGSASPPRLEALLTERIGQVRSEPGNRKLAVALGAAGGMPAAPPLAHVAEVEPSTAPIVATHAPSHPVPGPAATTVQERATTEPVPLRQAGVAPIATSVSATVAVAAGLKPMGSTPIRGESDSPGAVPGESSEAEGRSVPLESPVATLAWDVDMRNKPTGGSSATPKRRVPVGRPRLGRRAAIGGAVAIGAIAFVAGVLVLPRFDDGPASGPHPGAGTTTATQAPERAAGGLTPEVVLAAVPPKLTGCRIDREVPPTVVCDLDADGASVLVAYIPYASRASMDSDHTLEQAGFTRGTTAGECRNGGPYDGLWNQEGETRGRLECFRFDGLEARFLIVDDWVNNLTIAASIDRDADPLKLYLAWVRGDLSLLLEPRA